jgi:hypothetical protein
MANGNPFYVQPMGDYSQQLAGIGQTLQQIGAEKKRQARFNEVKSAMQGAWNSKDPDQMMQVAIEYPEAQATVKQMFGLVNQQTEDAATRTYRRVLADPKNAEKYLSQGIKSVQDAGGKPGNMLTDLGMYRRNPQGALRNMAMTYAAADPQGYRALSDADKAARKNAEPGDTAAIKDLKFYTELKKTDPELAKQFGQERGYVSDEGKELSVFLQKRLAESADNAIQSAGNVRGYEILASEFDKIPDTGGAVSKWDETLKQVTGSEDAVSQLRRRYNGVIASQIMANLPPGAASDADVALARSGFPESTAKPAYLASFLRGLAKIESAKAEFNEFKADYISKNGHERGMLAAWKETKGIGEEPAEAAPTETVDATTVILTHPQLGDVTEADIQNTMGKYNMTRQQVINRLQGGR